MNACTRLHFHPVVFRGDLHSQYDTSICVANFMLIHHVVFELFQSGPKCLIEEAVIKCQNCYTISKSFLMSIFCTDWLTYTVCIFCMYLFKVCIFCVTLHFCLLILPVPVQSRPHSLGSGDPDLRSLHLRPEHHHRCHAAPWKYLTRTLSSLIPFIETMWLNLNSIFLHNVYFLWRKSPYENCWHSGLWKPPHPYHPTSIDKGSTSSQVLMDPLIVIFTVVTCISARLCISLFNPDVFRKHLDIICRWGKEC